MELVHKICIYFCVATVIMLACFCNITYYRTNVLEEQIEVQNLILIEPDKDIFYASLFSFDWDNLLNFFILLMKFG